jgi:DNA-binding IclR family transcriptional regulator
MRLLDIAEKIEISESSASRIVNSLVDGKFANQDPENKKYSLTMKLSYIGNLISSKFNIREVSRRPLVELSESTRESVSLVIEQDSKAVYIDIVSGPDKLFGSLELIGKAAPLHCTAAGKCLMLNYSAEEIDRYIEKIGLIPLTRNSVTTKEQLLCELRSTASRGYAIDDEECEDGVRCVAAPVKDCMSKVVASISITGPSGRLTKSKIRTIKDQVLGAASVIAKLTD